MVALRLCLKVTMLGWSMRLILIVMPFRPRDFWLTVRLSTDVLLLARPCH